MRLSYKYRIYPTREQVGNLTFQLREACSLYNDALQERRGAYKDCRKSINFYDQCYQLKELRAHGLIGIANFNCCVDVLRRLDNTFKAFYSRIKNGRKAGYPRFKPAHRYDCLTFTKYGSGCKLLNKTLRIQGAGEIKIKLHRAIDGKIKTVSIKREIDKWYAVFSVEYTPAPLSVSAEAIGIDVGLTAFATLSDGREIDNPRLYHEAQRRLRVAQRRVARRKKGSKRRRKAVILLAKQHAHIQAQRSNFHHNISRSLVNQYGLIAIEDLNIKGLSRSTLGKSVHDVGWNSFFKKLAYKAESAGREMLKVNPRGTSQTCICGNRVPKTLSERRHLCSICGLEGNRDHISARIILGLALSLRTPTLAIAGVVREDIAFV